jgi:hypothetical protein
MSSQNRLRRVGGCAASRSWALFGAVVSARARRHKEFGDIAALRKGLVAAKFREVEETVLHCTMLEYSGGQTAGSSMASRASRTVRLQI